MNSYQLAPRAIQDLVAIRTYLLRENARAALEQLQHLLAACQMLADYPLAGRQVQKHRRYPVDKYIIQYRPMRGGVRIARIVDGRRDIQKILK